jgi:hypothetical protein
MSERNDPRVFFAAERMPMASDPTGLAVGVPVFGVAGAEG